MNAKPNAVLTIQSSNVAAWQRRRSPAVFPRDGGGWQWMPRAEEDGERTAACSARGSRTIDLKFCDRALTPVRLPRLNSGVSTAPGHLQSASQQSDESQF